MYTIELLGFLKNKRSEEGVWNHETDSRTVESVAEEELGVAFSAASYIVFSDGLRKPRTHVPQDGEKIKIMPLAAGG